MQSQAKVYANHASQAVKGVVHNRGQRRLTRFRVVWRDRLGPGPPAVVEPSLDTRALHMLGIRRLDLLASGSR
jgi:hypothetical protein